MGWPKGRPRSEDTKRKLSKGYPPPNPGGICLCGCGAVTPRATRTSMRNQAVKGEHARYVPGHANRGRTHSAASKEKMAAAKRGPLHPNWKGYVVNHDGYRLVRVDRDHPMASKAGYVMEHRLVAAEKMGRMLQPEEVVHHINKDRLDNRPANLMVFSSQSEHIRFERKRRRIAVDFDGTLVTSAWPGVGEWQPGAIEALRRFLSFNCDVFVFSARTSPFRPDGMTRRPDSEAALDVAAIRKKLDSEGFTKVGIWTETGKPPFDVMIDDKAERYNPGPKSWARLADRVLLRLGNDIQEVSS